MNPTSQPFRADLAEAQRYSRERRRRLLISIGAGVGMALIAILVWTFTYLLGDVPSIPPPAQLWSLNRAPGMTFLDRSGAVIATRGPKHGQRVALKALPAFAPRAFLAAEDRRFYSHGPLDMQGIGRAAGVNIGKGKVVQGGSTITQQLARTLFLTNDRTFRRKLQEAVVAYRLEGRMGKDAVLELYLNRIFFGAGAYGIEAASETYFAKPAKDLTLSEAALLAALPKAPSRLAPTNDLDAAIERSHLILATMRDEGWISATEERAALGQRPALAPRASGEAVFGYLLDMASAEAQRLAGGKAPDLVIRLSIDPALQTQAQTILTDTLGKAGAAAGASQGAVVLLTPDGAIRALSGGVDYRASPFNRAVQAKRQPGSAFKPLVYAAALEAGVQPTDTREDAPFRTGTWDPENYDGGYRGAVTVEEALAQSINTVAARLGSEVGRKKLGDISHRFGLEAIPDNPELPIALGAYELSLLDLTSAYQVFQNAGGRTRPHLVETITTARGDPLYLRQPSAPMTVYDPARSGAMVRMMQGVIEHGTGVRAQIGRPAAGKTGTSQRWRDAWFVGFTPDYAAGVWVGNDDGRPMAHVAGGAMPAEIWRQVMLAAHDGLPVRAFSWAPPGEAEAPTGVSEPRDAFYQALAADFAKTAAPPRTGPNLRP
ncbi:MAG: family penicillin-binding protein [Caulobacteraceae bacterium]|nr:family penicillin-binding protein [Caulobacteraceae bacterium]